MSQEKSAIHLHLWSFKKGENENGKWQVLSVTLSYYNGNESPLVHSGPHLRADCVSPGACKVSRLQLS